MRLQVLLLLLLLWPAGLRAQGLPGRGPALVFRAPASTAHPGESLFAATAYAALELTVAAGDAEAGHHALAVRAAFDPARAWVQDSTRDRERRMLAHEQVHFDICELVARKLRFRIAQVDQAGGDVFDRQLNPEVKCLLSELNALNDLYDQETAHSRLVDQQRKWATQVQRELAALAAYQSTAGDCWANN
jgi:hypothetical protein